MRLRWLSRRSLPRIDGVDCSRDGKDAHTAHQPPREVSLVVRGHVMSFERVYTVNDYYDGPRSGIADHGGQPYYYDCEWDEEADDYADIFILTPVDSDTLALALEQWAIWREWEDAYQ